jgi:Protein of unknown function (DUF1616)
VLRKQSDLFLGIILALALIIMAVLGLHPPILQAILALPFVLFVPGNALVKAIFPQDDLKWVERFLLAIGLSLGVTILSGLVLNITPWGLQADSWLLILSAFTLEASGIAIGRRWRMPASDTALHRSYFPLRQVVLLGLAMVLIVFALKLTFTPRAAEGIQGYTSLWILPKAETDPASLIIGIHSQETAPTQYILQITFNGQLLQEWSAISLAPGEESLKSIARPAGSGLLDAALYRADSLGSVYRRVSITLNP